MSWLGEILSTSGHGINKHLVSVRWKSDADSLPHHCVSLVLECLRSGKKEELALNVEDESLGLLGNKTTMRSEI